MVFFICYFGFGGQRDSTVSLVFTKIKGAFLSTCNGSFNSNIKNRKIPQKHKRYVIQYKTIEFTWQGRNKLYEKYSSSNKISVVFKRFLDTFYEQWETMIVWKS